MSITYSYDNGGNLISVKKYKYEEGEIKEENLIKEDIYGYQVSGWKDQMISFNGKKFTYDALGNPISYFGKKLTWSRGRELSKIEAGNQKVQYFYNDQGYRIRKSIEENGKKSEERYILNGSQILAMTKNNDAISFVYDDKGRLFSMKVNGAVYYYLHNLQNDVIGLLDSAGNQVVTYTYDTWGRVLTSEDKTPQKIGSKNPFRYREYFYDEECKWYYLQSRYYDPSLRRFINADDMDVLEVEQGSLNQYNLYAYCLNNPVNYVDEDGNIAVAMSMSAVGIGISSGALMSSISAIAVAAIPVIAVGILVEVAGVAIYTGVKASRRRKGEKTKEEVDPYARPGQKKQRRELRNKAKKKKTFRSRNNRRGGGPRPPKSHTPGRDHRKYIWIGIVGFVKKQIKKIKKKVKRN